MTKRLVASLLAMVVVLAFGCFGVLAEDESAVSADTSVAATESTDSETDTASAAESAEVSTATESTDTSAETSTDTETAKTSNTPWGLIVVLALIVIFVIVCIVCAKVQNKFGIWVTKVIRDYKSEFKKITWLSPKELVKQTGVVLVILIIAAVALGLLDWGFSYLISLLSNI